MIRKDLNIRNMITLLTQKIDLAQKNYNKSMINDNRK